MKLWFKILFLVAVAGALAWMVYTLVGPGGATRAQLARELEELKQQNREQEEKNRLLELEIEALKSNPDYLEYLARSVLGLVHPADMVFLLEQPPEGSDGGSGRGKGEEKPVQPEPRDGN